MKLEKNLGPSVPRLRTKRTPTSDQAYPDIMHSLVVSSIRVKSFVTKVYAHRF